MEKEKTLRVENKVTLDSVPKSTEQHGLDPIGTLVLCKQTHWSQSVVSVLQLFVAMIKVVCTRAFFV